MLTHWIWLTVECSAPTRVRNAMETIVVSSTAATAPMISAVSARLVSGGRAVSVLLIACSNKKLTGFLLT